MTEIRARAQSDTVVEESRPKLKKPRRYKVILVNDDYTPMEFVVFVLECFFGMSHEKAVKIMFQVHTQGRAECGSYTRDVAETKVEQVNAFSRQHEHPLLCLMEAA